MELSHTNPSFSRRINTRTFVHNPVAGSCTMLFSLLECLWGSLLSRDRNATLQQLIVTIQRRWGVRALRRFGQPTHDLIPVIATGFTDLDAALGIGGIPRGRITEFLGTPTSGMSTIVLTLMARA